MATLIAFSGLGGDYVIVEEDPAEVASLLDEADGLVKLSRIPAPVSEQPIATWVNPVRVAFLMEPVQQRRPDPPPSR
ncbi:MAG TPA: hypothetical protein VG474_02955 [Solirubrobacteraceae bacterium]|nr:hypothetical protein [Solirubrobacteraceae bacterium]